MTEKEVQQQQETNKQTAFYLIALTRPTCTSVPTSPKVSVRTCYARRC